MSLSQHKRLERFEARIERGDSCWNWTGLKIWNGYGVVRWNGKETMAHRVAYELARGPIPEGMTIDHLCRNRGCVRPDHLEAVSMKENILRGEGLAAVNAKKTVCPLGHPLDGRKQGERYCKTCSRKRALDYYHKHLPPKKRTVKRER